MSLLASNLKSASAIVLRQTWEGLSLKLKEVVNPKVK